MQQDILLTIQDLTEQITNDPDLDQEMRDQLLSVVRDVLDEPTPDGFKALAVLMDQLARFHKYQGAVDVITGAS